MRPRWIRGEAHAETATYRLGANLFAKLVTLDALQAFRIRLSHRALRMNSGERIADFATDVL